VRAARALLLALGLAATAAGSARAQENEPAPESVKAEKAAPPAKAKDGKRGKRKGELRLDEIRVDGKIQKPAAFFILQRQNLDLEGMEKKESFLPKIVKSTEKDPF
jgi:hypothetical protein